MRRTLPDLTVWGMFVAAPAAVFVVLPAHPAWDRSFVEPTGHFYIVSAVAMVSFVVAAVAALAALRLSDVRAVALAMAFVGMSGFFVVHGLATPGFLVERDYAAVAGFSARMGVLVAAVLLAASTFEPPRRLGAAVSRHGAAILGAWVAILGAYAAVALGR